MGFRFRKSVKAGPFRMTFSKSGVGYSVGGKGFRVTKKAKGGIRTTASIPGTGISYSKDIGGKKRKNTHPQAKCAPSSAYHTSYQQQNIACWGNRLCGICGAPIDLDAKFCSGCGVMLSQPAKPREFNLMHIIRKCTHYGIRIAASFFVWFVVFLALAQVPAFIDRGGTDTVITSPIPLLLPTALAIACFFLLKKPLNKVECLSDPDDQKRR